MEIINNIFKQNCGDSLIVLEKSINNKYKCKFLKYPCIIFAAKQKIKEGTVTNPQIEQVEFIDKVWPQNCGDSLRIIEKSSQKTTTGIALFVCEFINHPYKILCTKRNIQVGEVVNPQIELDEYINKTFKLPQGDFVVTEKTNKIQNKEFIWKGHFVNKFGVIPTIIEFRKSQLVQKCINNPDVVSQNKDILKAFILNTYGNQKPNLVQLAIDTKICLSHITHKINDFGLREYVEYSSEVGSFAEKQIRECCKKYKKDTLNTSTWELLDGKEIDIYIPSLNLGFEYNGNYWHSEIYKKSISHQEKTLLANKKGIDLFHIFEYEWLENNSLIESYIKSKLGIFDKKIGARNCIINQITNKEYQDFCNENHLQKSAGATEKFGLYYKGELIQIMSFSKPRFTDKFEWEIIRECSKQGYCILGGKEKLWSHFVKTCNPKTCISYCDFSKFDGKSYLKLGFQKERLNQPGFVWWNKKENIVYWRNPYKHQEMKNRGYLKIYDCGQLVFTWFNKDLK